MSRPTEEEKGKEMIDPGKTFPEKSSPVHFNIPSLFL